MAALPPYIPSRDSKLDPWANNFQTLIAANPALYGLMAADAVIITAAYNAGTQPTCSSRRRARKPR